MKNLLIASLIFSSSTLIASTLAPLSTMTNSTLQDSQSKISKLELTNYSALKKIITLKAKGSTPLEIRTNTIAQAVHTLCSFFDDGVVIKVNSKNNTGTDLAVNNFTENGSLADNDSELKTLSEAISAANQQSGVEVYSGSASGNNTSGTVLGIFDTKNNEIAVFSNSNCGSDD